MNAPVFGKFVESRHLQMKAIKSDHLHQSRHQIPERVVDSIGMGQRKDVGVVGIFGQDRFPSREGDARSRAARAAGCALQDSIDQIAHRVDLGQLRLFNVASKFFFEAAEQFDALHGVEAEIEIQIESGPQSRRGRARCFTNDLQSALHVRLIEPCGLVRG